jgi:hypothetical protein
MNIHKFNRPFDKVLRLTPTFVFVEKSAMEMFDLRGRSRYIQQQTGNNRRANERFQVFLGHRYFFPSPPCLAPRLSSAVFAALL